MIMAFGTNEWFYGARLGCITAICFKSLCFVLRKVFAKGFHVTFFLGFSGGS
jgi:hypothetical protein